jgi:predicted nucleic acid-binding protein
VRGVLVDAGPLIALIDRGDQHHARCVETLKALREPLVSVWPAITEAMYLLGPLWQAQAALWEMLESGAVELAPLDADDVPRMTALMGKYRNLPMDLADAALVRVAEREHLRQVFTLDQRDFRVYRALGLGRLSLLPV